MKKINLRELARLVNLSPSTVSKALRDSHEISAATKLAVNKVAQEFKYTPNPNASSLRKKKTKTIAVVLPEIADNFFSHAIAGIQSIAAAKSYHILIYLSHDKFEIEKNIIADCSSGRVDGVLVSISDKTDNAYHLQQLHNDAIPIVFFDREIENFQAVKVITNDYECGYMAAQHLIAQGCRKLAFLSVSHTLPICTKRANGFMAALKENKIETTFPIIYCTGTELEVYNQIKLFLGKSETCDGVVASVERLALQIYLAAKEMDISIPNNLKVIAFSTWDAAPILNPSLTTITQPAYEIGKIAASKLFDIIEKKAPLIDDSIIMLPSTLIERDSTK